MKKLTRNILDQKGRSGCYSDHRSRLHLCYNNLLYVGWVFSWTQPDLENFRRVLRFPPSSKTDSRGFSILYSLTTSRIIRYELKWKSRSPWQRSPRYRTTLPRQGNEGEGHFFLKAEHQQEICLTRQNTTAHINNLTLIFEYVTKKKKTVNFQYKCHVA